MHSRRLIEALCLSKSLFIFFFFIWLGPTATQRNFCLCSFLQHSGCLTLFNRHASASDFAEKTKQQNTMCIKQSSLLENIFLDCCRIYRIHFLKLLQVILVRVWFYQVGWSDSLTFYPTKKEKKRTHSVQKPGGDSAVQPLQDGEHWSVDLCSLHSQRVPCSPTSLSEGGKPPCSCLQWY